LEGKAMGASLPQAMTLVRRTGRLDRGSPGFAFEKLAETSVDPAILSNWLAQRHEMLSRESAMAERPPLPSY
jgi:hypothetical protein